MMDQEKVNKETNNKTCHYCGEVIYNALSDSSDSYMDCNGFWYCSYDKCYEESREVTSIF